MRRYVSRASRAEMAAGGEYGSAFRWQHGARTFVQTDAAGTLAAKARAECALDKWLEAGGISEPEHRAGLTFRADYQAARVAHLAQRSYEARRKDVPSGAWASPAERRGADAERAYKRWREAAAHLTPQVCPLVLAVCCEDGAIGWANRGALRLGLQTLQSYYRV